MVTVRIGPVPTTSVRAWVSNAESVLVALDEGREKLPFKLPVEASLQLQVLVADWRDACAGDSWSAHHDLDVAQLQTLVVYWFNVTKLDEHQRQRLGIPDVPSEARAFGDALGAAVGTTMRTCPELLAFARRLAQHWAECQPAFAQSVAAG